MIETKFVRTPARPARASPAHSPNRPRSPFLRRCLLVAVCTVCAVLLLQKFFLEPFRVTSSSMAPMLLGPHRRCTCPNCGTELAFARQPGDAEGVGGEEVYRKAWCFNCGASVASLAGATSESAGDQILVDKTAFLRETPGRWDLVVFRWLGQLMIKRILGLPGEELVIRAGDVYVDGILLRKSFEQAKAMRVLIWEMQSAPSGGWGDRFEYQGEPVACSAEGLEIDGRTKAKRVEKIHSLDGAKKSSPISDEYAYNGSSPPQPELVHDFLLDVEIEIDAGQGSITLGLFDGHDWADVSFCVAKVGMPRAYSWSGSEERPPESMAIARQEPLVFVPKGRYHVELALVDRRFHVRVDGEPVVVDAELPSLSDHRPGVHRPFHVTADGVLATVRKAKLYRDVHYSQRGEHAVAGRPVRLGTGQYFVLGDNSSISEDSRFWANEGQVARDEFVGRPIVVHLPSVASTTRDGSRRWQLPALDRIRWLR